MLVWRVVKDCHGGDPETRSLLAADVVGFSKLAGSDEERTLARLRALRSDLAAVLLLRVLGQRDRPARASSTV